MSQTASPTRGRPFPKGRSGNPTGRPKGSRNVVTQMAQKITEADADTIVAIVVNAAKQGDLTAAKIVLDRLYPQRKGVPVRLRLPPIDGPDDVLRALGATLGEVAAGNLTPEEGVTVASILDTQRRTLETADLDRRISELEQREATR